MGAILRIGLDVDLQAQAELVEAIDVGRADERRQRGEDVADRHVQALGLGTVDLDLDMRRTGAEAGEGIGDRGLGAGLLDHLVGRGLQLAEIEAAVALLDLHLEAAGIADALDRRRDEDDGAAVLQAGRLALQARGDRAQVLALFLEAYAPVVEHDEGDAGIGELRHVVEDRHAGDRHDLAHARRRLGDARCLGERGPGAAERGTVRHLHGDHQVALVLVGNEGAGQPGDAPAADPRQHQREQDHQAGVLDHAADQARVAVLDLVVAGIEGAEEDVALLRRHRRPEPAGALRRLQGRRVDRADEGGGGDHQGELGEHLAGQAGHEGGRDEHRHQHQGDADHRPDQLLHRLDRRVVGRHAALDMARHALDDDDRVVDHDADRQHDAEQRGEVDGEAERRHGGEGADDGDRDRGRRHQRRAPVLQEHDDHDQHQDAGLEQGHEHLVDRGADEGRGVERDAVGEAGREGASSAPPSSSVPRRRRRARSPRASGRWQCRRQACRRH